MDDDHRLLGPGEGIPPTKRTKLDPNTSETSGKLVGTKVGLAKEGGARLVHAATLSPRESLARETNMLKVEPADKMVNDWSHS